ncbi:MAG: DUF2029 domain-containing protein [Prevotellaceae bacterium]|jgi:hypothetical protein|nr:DUF2029 domain-containing protein [Prevotellaceae bacterium]
MKQKLHRFFTSKRNLYLVGVALVLTLSLLEVLRGRNLNFMRFYEATVMFWDGLCPYLGAGGERILEKWSDVFIYGPLFNIIFAPFILLPAPVAAVAWNLTCFTLYFLSIFSLPAKRYTHQQKCYTFLFTALVLFCTQLSFQYNPIIACIFIFAFSLLERERYLWAVLLIMLSAFTKVYGIFQLGLLLCYPKLWRNMGYAAVVAVVFLLLPALKVPLAELPGYYQTWINALTMNKDTHGGWQTIFYLRPFFYAAPSYAVYVQLATLAGLAALLLCCRRKYASVAFRAQALGILMGWVILFSIIAEKHTYVIALAGYMLWYWTITPTRLDRWLFWLNFVVFAVVPVDLLCPPFIMRFIFDTLSLELYLFAFTWLRMCWITFGRQRLPT